MAGRTERPCRRLELLNSQTARLGRLVDELLDVSRIESGKLEFRVEPR